MDQEFSSSEPLATAEFFSHPTITPTLVLGLGGTGLGALRHLKRRLVWLWHRQDIERDLKNIPAGRDPKNWEREVLCRYEMIGGPPSIQLLGVDTLPWANRPGDVYLNDSEYVYLGGYNASKVLQYLPNHPEIAKWWGWTEKGSQPGQIHSGARQIRAIGRLSFYRKYREFWGKLKPQIDRMTSLQAKQDTMDKGFPVATAGDTKRVYVIGSLCGGTGAGLFLDTVACLRGIAKFSESAIVTGVFVLPSVIMPKLNSDLQKDRVRANAYASLKELAYFQGNPFDLWLPGEEPMTVPMLYNRLYLVERMNEAGESLNSIDDVVQLIGNQVFIESITPVGASVWEYDVNITTERRESGGKTQNYSFSSFANSSMVVPKRDIQRYCELKYAAEIIQDGLIPELSPHNTNRLNTCIQETLRRLQEQVTGRAGRKLSQAVLEDEEFMDEDEFEEEFEEEDGADELQLSPAVRESASLEQLQQEINEITPAYGLSGALRFLEGVSERVDAWAGDSSRQVIQREADLNENKTLLRELEDRRPYASNFNFPPFSWFVSAAVRNYQDRILNYEDTVFESKRSLDRATLISNRWSYLQETIKSLVAEFQGRIALLENVCSEFERDKERLFNPDPHAGHQPFEMYTMFTMALGRRYIENRLYPEVRKVLVGDLSPDTKKVYGHKHFPIGQVDKVIAEQHEAGTSEHPNVLVLKQIEKKQLAGLINSIAHKSVQNKIDPSNFHILDILKENYNEVQMRLHDLFTRCRPFWRYDLDIGGHNEKNMEQIVIAGVPDKNNDEWKYLLKDFSNFNLEETNDPTRIDACRVVHGLPIEYLESLGEMKNRYANMLKNHTGPMQLDQSWEPGESSPLPEIELPSFNKDEPPTDQSDGNSRKSDGKKNDTDKPSGSEDQPISRP
jgi:hypothetical protein